jgi:hypothetical protein
MATYTRLEFVRAALIEVGALDATEAPSAEDYTLANQRTQQVFEALDDDGQIPFDLDGVIPARYFLPLVQIVAEALIAPFGKSNRAQQVMLTAAMGRKRLAQLNQRDYVSAPTVATYF